MNVLNGKLAFNIEVRETEDGSVVRFIDRTVTHHQGWESVRYKNKRYLLGGTIRGPLFIDLSKPR